MRILMNFCLFLLVASCGMPDKKERNETIVVKVSKVEPLPGPSEREFTFISKPYKTSALSFRVGGPVVDFDVHPGQFYRKGQMIAAIDNRDFRIRRERAEAVFRQAEAEYNRVAVLYEKGNISGSSYEKALAEYTSAKTAFETASNELEDTWLKAPFDGYIQTVDIERFQDVKASQQIVTFIDLSRLRIEVYIPENMAVSMGRSKDFSAYRIKMGFDALPGEKYTATDIEISKSTTSNNLSFLLTAIVDNPGRELYGGMSGVLSFTIPAVESVSAVSIPQAAVCYRPENGVFVWRLNPETARVSLVSVCVGNLQPNGRIEVLEGLTVGETIVLTGHAFLTEDKVVTVQK